ncbi:hypothetical protein SISSUDRAFT_973127, partial [Sistotremastrum suecicum HHB10207 ss-3]
TNRPPSPAPLLPCLITSSLHQTCLPTSATFSSLYLFSQLKHCFPSTLRSSGHFLIIIAFMIPVRVICKNT